MFSTYQSQDVTILLKDITGLVTPLGTREREARIQSGVHYSEMLPLEYEPSQAYLDAYFDALRRYAGLTAEAVARAAEQIWAEKGERCALVSLARAGTPIGILMRRYLRGRYGADVPHYTISIIRGRGIDRNAMAYLLNRHAPGDIQFVDGWTGKGAIQRSEPNFLCHALIQKEEVQQLQTDELIDRIYDGSTDKLFAALLGRKKLSAQQIEQLRSIVGSFEE